MINEFQTLKCIPADLLEVKRRKEHVKNLIIEYPRYQKYKERIQEHHYYSKGSTNPDGLFLSGETGVGKTTLLEEYTSLYPREVVDLCTKIPVLYLKVPVGATPKSVASKILWALKDPNYEKGTENSQTARLLYYLKKCEVSLVIIDELQHLIDRETKHVLNRASDWIKAFIDDAKIPVILCGMPESEKIFKHNEQLGRRFCEREEIKPFLYLTKEDQIEFRAFLNNIDKQLPFYKKSSLADTTIAEKIFYISNGIPYYIKKLITEATVFAAKSGNDFIDENHFYEAFNRVSISQRPYMENPFCNRQFNIIRAYDFERNKLNKITNM